MESSSKLTEVCWLCHDSYPRAQLERYGNDLVCGHCRRWLRNARVDHFTARRLKTAGPLFPVRDHPQEPPPAKPRGLTPAGKFWLGYLAVIGALCGAFWASFR